MEKVNVIMCCSDLSVKGGMVSVVQNFLGYDGWNEYQIKYVPTYVEKNKVLMILYFIFAYVKILFMCIGGKYKIAYFHTAERGSFYRKSILLRTLKHMGIKTVMHHHAAEFEEFYDSLSENMKKYVNGTLEMADLNIVLSKRLVPMISDKAPKARVNYLYNAVNTYETNPYNSDAKNVLFLGRLGKRKGTYDLLEVIKRLDKKINAEIKFFLCGDGDILGIEERIKDLGISHRIAHIGWISMSDKKKFFENTMINVLPSYNEGLPMTILETMAYGIPNISTNVASIPEVIIDSINGYMIEPGDSEALEERIIKLITDNNLRIDMSQKSWALISNNFALDNQIEKLKAYLAELR